jgi:hypothetical protein
MDWKACLTVTILAAILGCGGQTVGIGTDASTDASSDVNVADEGIDVVLSAACPNPPPSEGESCTVGEGFQCEYGTKFWAVCDVLFTCTNGAWHMNVTQSCPGNENADCPSSLSQITNGGDCLGQTQEGDTCSYNVPQLPHGVCTCSGSCGGPFNPDAGITWKCDAVDPTCPWPRPRFGSTCTGSASCTYDICCAGSQMQCKNGTWQGMTEMAGCP